ncbi:MAG TPA: hypothetical protein VJ952_02560 [Opitutales bacterium]|nr:hypothetical protein [Opitutales bacterium]
MDKLKALLLPLALVFAAIAIFEFGARYGASNTRAVALTGQLNNFVNLYKQVGGRADGRSLGNLEAVIDNHIVTAALERDAWYLRFKDEPKASLEQALAEALAIRGEGVIARFEAMQASSEEDAPGLSPARMEEIRRALQSAQNEFLIEASAQAEAVAGNGETE